MAGDCQLTSSLPETVTYCYLSIYLLMAIYGSVSSFRLTRTELGEEWRGTSFDKKVKAWWKNLWRLKRCYIPAVAHLVDQASDAGVLVQFYQLSEKEKEYGDDYCSGKLPLFSLACATQKRKKSGMFIFF